MTEKLTIVSPAGVVVSDRRIADVALAGDWGSARVALVDNSKPGAVPLLNGVADGLHVPDDHRFVIEKDVSTIAMTEEQLAQIRENADVVFLAVGNCGSCCSWTCRDAVTVTADLGIPAVLIVTTPFAEIARHLANSLGYPQLPTVVVEHPVGDLPYDVVHGRGLAQADRVRTMLSGSVSAPDVVDQPTTDGETFVVSADQADIDAFFLEKAWSDGLPVVAPTVDRVDAMLGGHLDRADDVVAAVAPAFGGATYRAIAANAVMAGCLPEYFAVLVAAVRGVCAPEFNLGAIQATTHPVGPMIMVSGPVAGAIGMNSGTNAFGPGNRANATIGRALRLVLMTIGKGVPGVTDRATMGQPGKYTFCFAENAVESPWEPYHAGRGYSADTSVVTVFGAEGPQNINDLASVTGKELLKTITGTMLHPGSNHHQFHVTEPFLALSPEHAAVLSRSGFTRESLQEFLFEHARLPISAYSQEKVDRYLVRVRPDWFGPANQGGVVPLAESPDAFQIAVVGGPGTHSMFVPSFGGTVAVSTVVEP
jgi:hypothetical protein